MTQTKSNILDNVIGAMVVGTATVMFAFPFALILFAPAYAGY